MLSESVHGGTRIRTLSVTWCHLNTSPRKMETLDQHRHSPSRAGLHWRWQDNEIPSHHPPPNCKLKPNPPPKYLVFEPHHLKTLSLDSQTVTAFLSPHLLPKIDPLHLKLDLRLSIRCSWCLWCSATLLADSTSHPLTQDMANLFFFPRTQKGSDPERRIIEPNPPDLLQSDDSYTA